jgi:outer membrane protein assembly factor BamB
MPGPGLSLDHPIVVMDAFRTDNMMGRFPAIHDGVMYVGSAYRFHAFHATSLRELWSISLNATRDSSPVVGNGLVYTLGRQNSPDYSLYALDASSGDIVWRARYGDVYTPTLVGNTAFLADFRQLVALDATSGSVKWSYLTDGFVENAPAVEGDLVVFRTALNAGDSRNTLHALDVSSGEERWRFGYETPIRSTPAIAHGTVYFNDGTQLHALDSSSGEERWRHEYRFTILSFSDWTDPAPTIANGVVYIGYGESLKALDANSGEPIWEFLTGADILASSAFADGVIYVGSSDQQLYALDAASGTELWRYRTSGDVCSPGMIDGYLYVMTSDNSLYLFTNQVTTFYFVEAGQIYAEPSTDSDLLLTVTGGEVVDKVGASEQHGDTYWTQVTIGDVNGWTYARYDVSRSPVMDVDRIIYMPAE